MDTTYLFLGWRSGLRRWIQSYPLVFALVVLCILAAVLLLVPVRLERQVLAPVTDEDRTYFGGEGVVAQEFVAEPGLSSIRIHFGPTNANAGPFILHIRSSIDGEDIRSVPLFGVSSEEAVFSFAPILRIPESKLVWILEAPHVPAKYFWVYREHDSSAFPEGRAYVQGRAVRGNFAFTLVRTLPRAMVIWEDLHTWAKDTSWNSWEVWSILAAVVAMAGYVEWMKRGIRVMWSERGILLLIMAISLVVHIGMAVTLPAIHDEGAYIQDVRQAVSGVLPFRDVLTKGPLFLLILFVWQFFIPHLLVAWRLVSVIASLTSIVGIWFFGRELGFKKGARLWAAALIGLVPGAVALTSPLLLQVVLIPISLFALTIVLKGAKTSNPRWLVIGALLMNAAYFTRVSSVVIGVMGAILICLYSSRRWRDVGIYIVSGLVFFLCMLGLSLGTLGLEKTAVMFNFEAVLVSQQRSVVAAEATTDAEPIMRQIVIQSRYIWQVAPLLLSSFLAWIGMWMSRRHVVRSLVFLIIGVLLSVSVFQTLTDTDFLLPFQSPLLSLSIVALVFALPSVFALVHFLHGKPWQPPKQYVWLATWVLVWLLLLIVVYGGWGRFRQSYLAEFIVPLVLFFVMTYEHVFASLRNIRIGKGGIRLWLPALFVGVMATSLLQGCYLIFAYPFTGTIDRHSLNTIAAMIEEHVPAGEQLFTAQPIATAFSDRPIMFGYAHPGWYREARLGFLPDQLLAIFFKKPEEITQYLRNDATYVLFEDRTEEVYFDGYPDRQEILRERFELVDAVDNEQGGEVVSLYRRKQ